MPISTKAQKWSLHMYIIISLTLIDVRQSPIVSYLFFGLCLRHEVPANLDAWLQKSLRQFGNRHSQKTAYFLRNWNITPVHLSQGFISDVQSFGNETIKLNDEPYLPTDFNVLKQKYRQKRSSQTKISSFKFNYLHLWLWPLEDNWICELILFIADNTGEVRYVSTCVI